MKSTFIIFTTLIIYASFCSTSNAQQLLLSIETEQDISTEIKNELNIKEYHKDAASITKETSRILTTFQQLGFLECKLDTIKESKPNQNDSEKKHFIASYIIGKQIEEITIYTNNLQLNKKELIKISGGKITDTTITIHFKNINKLLTSINETYAKSGDPFSKLRLSGFSKQEKKITATLITSQTNKRKIDSIIIKGYEKFPRSFIKYFANIKKGQLFNIENLNKKNSLLNATGFAKTTKPPEALFKKNKTYIYLYLEKERYNNFDGILGFTTNETTQKLEFNGYLNLELNNNLNFGEQLAIYYKADGGQQTSFSTRVKLPYLFKSPLGIKTGLRIFRKDSTFITSNQNIALTYQLFPSTSILVGYENESSSNLEDTETISTTTVEDYKISSLLSGIEYTKYNENPLFPTKTRIDITSKIGRRNGETNNSNQIGITLAALQHFELSPKNAIFLKNNTAYLNSNNYLENELYRFGGIQSIRGFDENSINASFYSTLNIEYRYTLNNSLYAHTITDVGYFENTPQNTKENLYSFGFGFGLKTGSNLFKFAYANGKTGNNSFKFSNSKIHISLISRF